MANFCREIFLPKKQLALKISLSFILLSRPAHSGATLSYESSSSRKPAGEEKLKGSSALVPLPTYRMLRSKTPKTKMT